MLASGAGSGSGPASTRSLWFSWIRIHRDVLVPALFGIFVTAFIGTNVDSRAILQPMHKTKPLSSLSTHMAGAMACGHLMTWLHNRYPLRYRREAGVRVCARNPFEVVDAESGDEEQPVNGMDHGKDAEDDDPEKIRLRNMVTTEWIVAGILPLWY